MCRLSGRVVVVAGGLAPLPAVAALAAQDGAFVALITTVECACPDEVLHFQADANADEVWERIAPHIEQRLGPVDAVVTDALTADSVRAVFSPDFRRRGHGTVLVVGAEDDPRQIVNRLTRTP
jgi:NAD(P)-dependent dehydrogenase (short-subunit alcohol dehydrogenase family)